MSSLSNESWFFINNDSPFFIMSNRHDVVDNFIATSNLFFVGQDSNDSSVVHVKIPLMHVGANAKGLYWKADVLKKIAPMFKNTTFKYDLEGREGSSHVPEKLYSPYFDVGWTSDAYYDEKSQTLWVEGDVTHPEPMNKIKRLSPSGRRELNYASMGVLINPDDVVCSVCGKKMTDCGHKRNENYNGKIAYAVPSRVEKALHVALTNAPADSEAVIAEAVFQENRILRGETTMAEPTGVGAPDSYTNQESRPNVMKKSDMLGVERPPAEQFQKNEAGATLHSKNPTDDKFAKTANAVPAMQEGEEEAAPAPGAEEDIELVDVIKALIMRVKALEEKVNAQAAPAPAEAPAPPAETADIANKYFNKLRTEVADLSVRIGKHKNVEEAKKEYADMDIKQLETLSVVLKDVPVRHRAVETADVSEYGIVSQPARKTEKEFADMTPAERRAKYGEFGSWDGCFRPQLYK